ncbi:hypothetical protein [Chromobacterium sp. CV08]|uniref:hypothetical protein n=1 Tax=Chromobacterium sp. CV08 TaxID=3133274 RepID=UPI003DA868BB
MYGITASGGLNTIQSHAPEHSSVGESKRLEVADLKKTMRPEDLKARGAAISELSKLAPSNGMNLWKVNVDGAELHLLGTMHREGIIQDKHHGVELLNLVRDKKFDVVYLEVPGNSTGKSLDELAGQVQEVRKGREQLASAQEGGKRADILRAEMRLKQYESVCEINKAPYDDLFLSAAGKVEYLETADSRVQLANHYKDDGDQVRTYRQGGETTDADHGDDTFMTGNENASFLEYGQRLAEEGNDYACCEARSNQWLSDKFFDNKGDYENRNILWVVGANHIPGLLVTLQAIGGDGVSFEPVLPRGQ